MNKKEEAGVYQLENGNWAFRYIVTVERRKKVRRRTRNEFGKPFKTKDSALKTKQKLQKQDIICLTRKEVTIHKTVAEVFQEYCQTGRKGKAYATIRKQDSLWRNHLKPRFGKRYVDEISVAEVNDYLTMLYYEENRAYKYVESFLKMFYLIFGQAYSRNYLDVDTYNKLCVNKDTKIHMPKMKVDEENEIVTFSKEELRQLDEYFCGTNAETAYLIGKYCGLRINECYGLKWSDIDLEEGTIRIERQMQYQDGVIKLVPLKTRNAKRTMYLAPPLKAYLKRLYLRKLECEKAFAVQRQQNQIFIEDTNGKVISSLELVNTLENGKRQTINSMKYHVKQIQRKLGIHFKYHYLRHTYGTALAELNTPAHILCNQMGHGDIKVTQKYYIAVSQRGVDALRANLQSL